MFEKNMAMKVFGYVFMAFWAVYLMVFGVVFYFAFSGAPLEAFDYIDGSTTQQVPIPIYHVHQPYTQ